jgi:hypothetical protein
LASKAHELDDGRRRLAERGRQLADQRKESTGWPSWNRRPAWMKR